MAMADGFHRAITAKLAAEYIIANPTDSRRSNSLCRNIALNIVSAASYSIRPGQQLGTTVASVWSLR
jgi:hypothetical protein